MRQTLAAALLGAAAALAAPSGAALAQQQQAAPAAPAWAQGRPDSMANSALAPHAPRLTHVRCSGLHYRRSPPAASLAALAGEHLPAPLLHTSGRALTRPPV